MKNDCVAFLGALPMAPPATSTTDSLHEIGLLHPREVR